MAILDQYGRPVKADELTREHGRPSAFGVRQAWYDSIATGLTPQGLANLLASATQGDARDYLTLAMEMEERDLHYGGVLGVRKLAVSGLAPSVEAASDEAKDIKLADEVRKLIRKPEFGDLVADSLDALGKSFSAVEIIWQRSERQWWPERYEHRDQRFFAFDRETLTELRLLDEQDPVFGIPLAPFKWVVHRPRLRTGITIRGGIARVVAWAHMFKCYAIKDWMAFAEVFGMPLRLGKYGANASAADIAILKTAVANIGIDAAAVIPTEMEIEFQDAASARGGEALFERLADWLDNQVTKYVLGQTGTTSGTPGKLGNEESQNQVRQDIRQADANQLARTINRDLIEPYIDLNFGKQDNYPRVQFATPQVEDLDRLSLALNRLIPMGLKVQASEVRDRFGLADPEEGAEILEPLMMGNNAMQPAVNRQQGSTGKAINREVVQVDTVEELAKSMESQTTSPWADLLGKVKDIAQQSPDLASLRIALLEAFADLPAEELGEIMAAGFAAAELAGRVEVNEGE